ncbi:major facilitator superfamily domain-containing protein [Xylariaceae sp. FL1651]|nr:major facilitator superfamily domain-containing protein [Xylariaceae sp. FL1651]
MSNSPGTMSSTEIPASIGDAEKLDPSQAQNTTTVEAKSTVGPPPQRSPPPDGGLVAWLQVLGSWCLSFNCWGIVNTYGVFQTYYETQLLPSQSPSNLAWIGSIQGFLLLFIGAITGPLYDHGYLRHLLVVGSLLMVVGTMLLSISNQYWQIILTQGLVIGLGGGCLFVPSVAILPTYFSRRTAFVIGIAGSGSGIGGIIYPLVFRRLLDTVGFPWAVRVVGFIMLGTLIVPLTVLRMRTQPPAVRKLFDLSAWTEPPYFLFALGGFFGFIGMYLPLYYVETYAIEMKIMGPDMAANLIPILNAGSTIGRIVPNYGADKTGPLNMFVPVCLALAILSYAWIGVKNSPGLIIFTLLYGFFSGAFLTLPFSSVVTLSPHLGVVGVRLGMSSAVVGLGLLIGTPVGGAVLARGWTALQAFGGSALLLGGLFIASSRVAKAGPKIFKKA